MRKTIVVACDHAGFELKDCVMRTIDAEGFDIIDVGAYSADSVDFPDFAQLGAEKILSGKAQAGIFLCGSGVGVCIAANKIPGIYASVCHDCYSARQGVEHDAMNVLCLGARIIGTELAMELVRAFLHADFNNKTNQVRRFEKIKRLEIGDLYLSNKIEKLHEAGQSLWFGQLSRSAITNGSLKAKIDTGEIRGLTAHPCTLCDALMLTDEYDTSLAPMVMAGWDHRKIFNQLSVVDIREIAGLFRQLYIDSNGKDGYVMFEIDPNLSFDQNELVKEGRRIWTSVNRPNLMICISATAQGLETGKQLIQEGINVSFTMIASVERLAQALNAWAAGIEARIAEGKPVGQIGASFVVNVAGLGDELVSLGIEKNQAANAVIANCQAMYQKFYTQIHCDRMTKWVSLGANPPLFIWTNVSCSLLGEEDCLRFADALIGESTVMDVVSDDFLSLLKTQSRISASLPAQDNKLDAIQQQFAKKGIDLSMITKKIEEKGLTMFTEAYNAMMGEVGRRSNTVKKSLGSLYEPVNQLYQQLEQDSIVSRMFAKDPTVWTFDTQAYPEIRNRLGWLDAHLNIAKMADEFRLILKDLRDSGFKKVLLLGMGGSSLAPEVMAITFKNADGLKLEIIDSTDPGQVLEADHHHPLHETVYVVSSKSGGTAEIKAFLDYFYAKAQSVLGEKAGSHFIAITDPGTALERSAKEMGFRYIVLSDPSIGGRFSVLSPFGTLPATLIGLDPDMIAKKATRMAKICAPSTPVGSNEGAALGVYMGAAALHGRDKLTILTDPEINALGSWLEQLIAESSGKNGKGIVPVDLEPELCASAYGKDRAFVYVDYSGSHAKFVEELIQAGQPVLVIKMAELEDLFAEFYRWEIAVSVACSLIGVNAFDQPNVQDSKTRTVAKINEFKANGKLNDYPVCWQADGIRVFYNFDAPQLATARNIHELIDTFLDCAKKGEDYVGINAYLPRNDAITADLQKLRTHMLEKTGCATTLGFGPRFQHSTGQLHKGGANNGVFIQIVADAVKDALIPNEDMTFAVLERAQALGDFEALLAVDRRAIRIDLGDRPASALY